jgi:hypothetical protein
MRTPSPPYCRLDLAPPLADQFILGVAPIDYGPILLLKPFRFHLTMDTLPSGVLLNGGFRSALICFQLSLSCPFRLLHTFPSLRPARHYPRFWIRRSSSERRRDLNPHEQRAAQHTLRSSPTTGRAPLPTSLTLIGPLPPEPLKTLPVLLRSRAILPYRAARNHPVYGG